MSQSNLTLNVEIWREMPENQKIEVYNYIRRGYCKKVWIHWKELFKYKNREIQR